MTTSIITLNPDRWQEFKALRLEALQQDPIAFGSSYEEEVAYDDSIWIERATKAFQREGNITVYADFDGKLVGMMGAFWSNRVKTGHIASIYGVYIAPSMRGKGVASQLMNTVLEQINSLPQIVKVMLTVNAEQTSAQRLYEKFGFTTIGISHKDLKVGDQFYDEIYMEKLL